MKREDGLLSRAVCLVSMMMMKKKNLFDNNKAIGLRISNGSSRFKVLVSLEI